MYTRSWAKEEDALGMQLLREGKSLEEISLRLNRSIESISQRKTKVWSIKRTVKGVPTNQDFFLTLTAESAYVLGFIITDGHLRKDGDAILITQSHAVGYKHLEKIQFYTGGSIYSAKNGANTLTLMGKSVCSQVNVLGVPIGKKSLNVQMPTIPDNLFWHFIRGVLDGDGHVAVTTRVNVPHLSCNFCSGSEIFLKAIQDDVLHFTGVCGHLYKGVSAWYLRYSGSSAETLLQQIYAVVEDQIYLDRKYDTFTQYQKNRADAVTKCRKLHKKKEAMFGYPETPPGFSAFSSHLAEMLIEKYSHAGDVVLDPFAGWGTRMTACVLKQRAYVGYEVAEPALSNIKDHLARMGSNCNVIIHNADGCLLENTLDNSCDFVLTCPPYWQKEVYAGGVNQLSTIGYNDFLTQVRLCAKNSYRCLKRGKYAAIVVGSYRVKGSYITVAEDVFRLWRDSGFEVVDVDAVSKPTQAIIKSLVNLESGTLGSSKESLYIFKTH